MHLSTRPGLILQRGASCDLQQCLQTKQISRTAGSKNDDLSRPAAKPICSLHTLHDRIHITHPRELTSEAGEACMRLADAGLPLGSQTVLLKGVNDDAQTLRDLMRGLLRIRVRPYYLLQCDPITGSGHFRTSLEHGKSLIRELRGHLSGYAIPHYIVDLPGGGGKIPLVPEYITGHDGKDWIATNFQGIPGFRYPDPDAITDRPKGSPICKEFPAEAG